MPNYNVNWTNFVFYNVPHFLRKVFRLKWIDLIIFPVIEIYSEFITFKDKQLYKVVHTSQKISIEKVLNDAFDPTGEGIFIGLLNPIDKSYLYTKAMAIPQYIYNKWTAVTNYAVGEFSSYDSTIWKATAISVNEIPFDGSAFWEIHPVDPWYLRNKSEYAGKGFIVWVPVAVVYDEAAMKALIDAYRLAGMHYIIQNY